MRAFGDEAALDRDCDFLRAFLMTLRCDSESGGVEIFLPQSVIRSPQDNDGCKDAIALCMLECESSSLTTQFLMR